MIFSGKQVSLQFGFENKAAQLLSREMSMELGESLQARGYTIRSITFGLQKEDVSRNKANSKNKHEKMTIVG